MEGVSSKVDHMARAPADSSHIMQIIHTYIHTYIHTVRIRSAETVKLQLPLKVNYVWFQE
jgi:hypothetical protein